MPKSHIIWQYKALNGLCTLTMGVLLVLLSSYVSCFGLRLKNRQSFLMEPCRLLT